MTETASKDIELETPLPQVVEKHDEFVANLSKIYQRLKYSKKLKTGMKEVEQDLLGLLDVKLFTVYQSVDNARKFSPASRAAIQATMIPSRSECHSAQHHWPVMLRLARELLLLRMF